MDTRINNEFNNSHVCDHLVQCICKASNLIQYSKGAASPKKEKKEVKRQESVEIASPSPLTKHTEEKEPKESKPKRSSKLAL
tara:strand:+ start:88 stop:333 length:246 start_codon:yes stop_codon:yes gene_type:complete